MNPHRNLILTSALVLAFALSVDGCKSSTSPSANPGTSAAQPGQQPAAAQSGATGQPAAGASTASNTPQTPAAPPPPTVVELPAGSDIRVRLDSDLGSKISQPGDAFSATVASDVLRNGEVIIPKGARAEGTVIDAKPLGKFKGGALLSVRLDNVHTRWGTYPVQTSSISHAEKGKGKRSTGFIAGGAGLGAIIGGLAGGGKGAAIGALAGGGAGTAGAAFTGNKQIVLPAETLLTFHLEHSVHITETTQSAPGLQQR